MRGRITRISPPHPFRALYLGVHYMKKIYRLRASDVDLFSRRILLVVDAIREGIFLRMHDIVRESGSDFAFPSQTLYMARDENLDFERSERARNEVQAWRNSGKLPFPTLSADRINELKGTLDWPPRGSANLGAARQEDAEPLSADPETKNEDEAKR